MKIIEYRNYDDLLVEFEVDGYKKKTNYYSFNKGCVRHDKYKKAYKTLADKRIGSVNKNHVGEEMKVIEYTDAQHIVVEFQDSYKAKVNTSWGCFKNGSIKNPYEKENGIYRHANNFIDITGRIYNNLQVLYWDTSIPKEEIQNSKRNGLWRCKCLICGNEDVWTTKYMLESGMRKACRGCAEKNKSKRKYEIEYDLTGQFGIGYTYNTHNPFYFDLEDYDKIKDYSWKENMNGYAVAVKDNEYVSMHRIVTGAKDGDIVDHRCHNNMDNRKKYLRVSTCKNNTRNEKLARNNTSGVTGVSLDSNTNLWHSYIWVDGKTIHLGRYSDFNLAVQKRKEAEDIYFGEWSYDNSMSIMEDDINE